MKACVCLLPFCVEIIKHFWIFYFVFHTTARRTADVCPINEGIGARLEFISKFLLKLLLPHSWIELLIPQHICAKYRSCPLQSWWTGPGNTQFWPLMSSSSKSNLIKQWFKVLRSAKKNTILPQHFKIGHWRVKGSIHTFNTEVDPNNALDIMC